MKKSDVIEHFGSHEKAADALCNAGIKISRVAVTQWPSKIPELRAFQIEKITKGKLKV